MPCGHIQGWHVSDSSTGVPTQTPVLLPRTLQRHPWPPSRSLSQAEPVDKRFSPFSKVSCLSLYFSSAHLGLGVNEQGLGMDGPEPG